MIVEEIKIVNLGHVMVDIETLGNSSHSVICSIAAVEFNLATGSLGREFNSRIKISSSLELGLKVDASTLEWWMMQDQEARELLFKGGEDGVKDINLVLTEFFNFIQSLGSTSLQVWGNSARFDLGILENAFHLIKMELPWRFSKERDVRTLVSFAPDVKESFVFNGIKHDALSDCYHQIGYCTAIYKKIIDPYGKEKL